MLKTIFFLLLPLMATGQIKAPNYHFSLDELKIFYPDNSLTEIEKKYQKTEIVFDTPPFLVKRYEVSHERYKFPVLVQYQDGKVLDFYARLPDYFLHNVFHQSLINRYGKQDEYLKVEEQALYRWNNENGLKIVYSGGCTITCFPIFMAVEKSDAKVNSANYESLLLKMKKAHIKF